MPTTTSTFFWPGMRGGVFGGLRGSAVSTTARAAASPAEPTQMTSSAMGSEPAATAARSASVLASQTTAARPRVRAWVKRARTFSGSADHIERQNFGAQAGAAEISTRLALA